MYPKLVIFDFDGTLFDTHAVTSKLFAQTFEDFGIEGWDSEVFRVNNHLPGNELLKVFLPSSSENFRKSVIMHYRQLLGLASFDSKLTMLNESAEVLDYLESLTIPVAILSNRPTDQIKRMVYSSGIPDHVFSEIVGVDRCRRPKPSPIGIQLLQRNFGVARAESILMIGDSIADHDAALAAGCLFMHAQQGSVLDFGGGVLSYSSLREFKKGLRSLS